MMRKIPKKYWIPILIVLLFCLVFVLSHYIIIWPMSQFAYQYSGAHVIQSGVKRYGGGRKIYTEDVKRVTLITYQKKHAILPGQMHITVVTIKGLDDSIRNVFVIGNREKVEEKWPNLIKSASEVKSDIWVIGFE